MDYTPNFPFDPNRLLHSGNVQVLLSRLNPPPTLQFANEEELVLLDGGPDESGFEQRARLHGYYTFGAPLRARRNLDAVEHRGLVMMIHGWEACSHAAGVLRITDALLEAGYDVFRLNVRDHGPGLHVDPRSLNRGFFLGTLLNEIAVATQQVAQMAGDTPFHIVGASLGGNLALRLATVHNESPFHNLRSIVAICPAISPRHSIDAMDALRLYRQFYRKRWLNNLLAKETLFPDLYDFAPIQEIRTVRGMTDWLIEHYGERFGLHDSDAYLDAYRVVPEALNALQVPTTVISAQDDFVIPVDDFHELPNHPLLSVQLYETGGHCGFVDGLPPRHYMPLLALNALQ